MPRCLLCAAPVAPARAALGYPTCLPCGAAVAARTRHTVVPLHKSNYVLVTNPATLKQLNPKRVNSDD